MENKEFEVPAPYEPKRFVVDDMRGDVLCNFISAIMDGGNAIYWTSRSPNDAVFWPCFCAHGIPLPFPIGPTSVALMVKEYWKSTNASRIVLEEMPGKVLWVKFEVSEEEGVMGALEAHAKQSIFL